MSNNQLLLRLNSQALNDLFPEGSQARVNLQQAVVAEFVSKNIKPKNFGEDIQQQIESATEDVKKTINGAKVSVTNAMLKELGVVKGGWGEIVLNDEIKQKINDAVKQTIDMQVQSAINAHIADKVSKLSGAIEHNVQAAVGRMVNKEIGDAVKARVSNVLEQIKLGTL